MTLELLRQAGLPAEHASVAVQGFGKVGAWYATFLQDAGCRIVAVSDVGGGLANKDGLDVRLVMSQVGAELPSVSLSSLGDQISNEELLGLPVDALAPYAIEQVIHFGNVGTVLARRVVEGANGPVTPEAAAVPEADGVCVIPDILANAGGVVVSYFEWVQGRQGWAWNAATVDRRLTRVMEQSLMRSQVRAARDHLPLRGAATVLAVERVADALCSKFAQ